jgi:hypothetical protein
MTTYFKETYEARANYVCSLYEEHFRKQVNSIYDVASIQRPSADFYEIFEKFNDQDDEDDGEDIFALLGPRDKVPVDSITSLASLSFPPQVNDLKVSEEKE